MSGPLLLIGAILAIALGACAAAPRDSEAGLRATIILARHAEKAGGPDPPLTERGRRRAEALVGVVRSALPSGARLDAVLATDTLRAQETARPAAEAFGLVITTTTIGRGVDAYFDDIVALVEGPLNGKNVLVVGHSNTTPDLVMRLAGAAGLFMSEEVYDRLYVVRVYADGRREWEERRHAGE